MPHFLDICVALIAVELAIVVVVLAVALVKIGQAAKAVEVLAYRIEDRVAGFGRWTNAGLVSGLEGVARFLGGFFGARRRGVKP